MGCPLAVGVARRGAREKVWRPWQGTLQECAWGSRQGRILIVEQLTRPRAEGAGVPSRDTDVFLRVSTPAGQPCSSQGGVRPPPSSASSRSSCPRGCYRAEDRREGTTSSPWFTITEALGRAQILKSTRDSMQTRARTGQEPGQEDSPAEESHGLCALGGGARVPCSWEGGGLGESSHGLGLERAGWWR